MTRTKDYREVMYEEEEEDMAEDEDSDSQILGNQWWIFRVPAHMREIDQKAYTPRVVSIGPFHRNNPALRAMEAQKFRFFNRLKERMGYEDRDVGFEATMKEMEAEARKYYSEDFPDIGSDDFVKMMVLDGCFIVELMRLFDRSNKGKYVDEPMFATRWMLPNITRDLLMLENQLPMFVLEEIFNITECEGEKPLTKLAVAFFQPLRPQKSDDKKNYKRFTSMKLRPNNIGDNVPRHLLALFHSSFVRTKSDFKMKPQEPRNRSHNLPGKLWIHEAKRLRKAGVRFRNNPGNLLNIEFSNVELRIPTLYFDDSTGPLLRNLLAYEQCNAYAPPYFTCFAIFLNSIVDTPEDVAILRDAGIIMQALGGPEGDEEVVKIINSLTKELIFDMLDMENCYIAKQIDDINSFCQSWRSKCLFCLNQVDLISLALSFIFPSLKS